MKDPIEFDDTSRTNRTLSKFRVNRDYAKRDSHADDDVFSSATMIDAEEFRGMVKLV